MRLLAQRVSRATVDIAGAVEHRTGPGLVLSLAIAQGDTVQLAEQLARKVLKLHLWPELLNPDVPWRTNVVDNGYEVLVLLQQSLCTTFPRPTPNQDRALPLEEARPIWDAFLEQLKKGHQEELVVSLAPEVTGAHMEMSMDLGGVFELGAGDARAAAPDGPQPAAAKAAGPAEPLKADLGVVTRALQRIPKLPKAQAAAESMRVFRVLGTEKFLAALGAAPQPKVDEFTEALESISHRFTLQQQEQITEWTGVSLTSSQAATGTNGTGAGDDEGGGDDVERQLAELREDLSDPRKAARRQAAGDRGGSPSTRQATAPGEPPPAALAARQWAASRNASIGGPRPPTQPPWAGKGWTRPAWSPYKGGGKGKGPRPRRQSGIVSLDESASLHGTHLEQFHFGQLARDSDRQVLLMAKEEADAGGEGRAGEPASKRIRLPKGVPTVAPMVPIPEKAPMVPTMAKKEDA